MALMESENALGEVFNIGGIEETTIYNLATKIIEKTGSNSRISLVPYEEAFQKDFEDMQRRVPGIDKIQGLVGFDPKKNLDVILDDVIHYMKS